ncbi:TetR/AcrR family transcriptional regulator [Nucisporomicrobium flavum]|uniref:TetR/AcrR family transcriptional regulator n=1 Tax=Nucisporomicrobium flavum TaxID=2785915 RepID=UPI003C30235E
MVVKRRYASAQRQEQARRTRNAVLDAAATLFVDPGYAATPLTAVAARAGVAVQTVYAVFGSKRNLLSALLDRTIAGDDEPVALPQRAFVAEIHALAGPEAKLARYAVHLEQTNARQVDVMLALLNAASADADAAAILRKNDEERRRGMLMFAAELAGTGRLRAGHDVESAADVLWLAMDVRNYDWLVRRRGWTPERYRDWYVRTTAAALLDAAAGP